MRVIGKPAPIQLDEKSPFRRMALRDCKSFFTYQLWVFGRHVTDRRCEADFRVSISVGGVLREPTLRSLGLTDRKPTAA